MDKIIKWIVTPKCRECDYWHKGDKACTLKQCAYKAKRYSGRLLTRRWD